MQKLLVEVVMFFCRIRPAEMENLLAENIRDGELELTNDGFVITLQRGWIFEMKWNKNRTRSPFYRFRVPFDRGGGVNYCGQFGILHEMEASALYNKVVDALLSA